MSSFLNRVYSRLHREEQGFTVLESVIALSIIFVALLGLVYTATLGFSDIALSRQRQTANQIANKIMEEVRGLSYSRVGQGLETGDQASDNQNIVSCPPSAIRYYKACPASDPYAETIVKSDPPVPTDVLNPHVRRFEPPQYPNTYTSYVYVTNARTCPPDAPQANLACVPQAGAYRVIVHVTWTAVARTGAKSEIVTQSLIYTPEGTTGATSGGGVYPFFYGTASVSRAPITVTPNAGVSGGTGVTGFPSWDSMTEDLYGLDANVQQQQYAKAEGKALMTGARKTVSGTETTSGGVSASSTADDDPATPAGTSDAPAGLSQSAVSSQVAGGGNSLDVVAASGGTCPGTQLRWLSGMETGTSLGWPNGEMEGGGATVSADSSIKRTGSYSLRVPAGGDNGMSMFTPFPRPAVVVLHFAIRLPSLPGSDVPQLAWMESTGITPTVRLQFGYEANSNKFRLTWLGAAGQVVSTVAASAGTWHVIDILYDAGANPDSASWRVDGVPQPTTTSPATTNATIGWIGIGAAAPNTADIAAEANYDDMGATYSAADFPLPDFRVVRLRPNGMGPSFGNPGTGIFDKANLAGNSGITSTTWQWLTDVPMTGHNSWVYQINNSTTNYIEVTFDDTTEDCIAGVKGIVSLNKGGTAANIGRTDILEGSQVTTLYNGNHEIYTGLEHHRSAMIATAGGGPWTTAQVNGLISRFGYSSDANPDPFWESMQLQMAYVTVTAGAAGTETGATASTTAANAAIACGNPTQTDGRPCSYAREDYSTAGPPHLESSINLAGSGAGKCTLFKFTPSTAAGSTSYAWGRRTAGTGGPGTIKESAVRFYGANEFGGLCGAVGAGPIGWPGYLVKFDAGTAATQVQAEAGVGAAAPSYTAVGTISYWNGSGFSTMTPPPDGGEIPVYADPLTGKAVSHAANGFRVEISNVSLASNGSNVYQNATYEGRATVGSPVVGTFDYKVTNTTSGAVVADLHVAVDLGTLTATARYAP